MSDNPKDHALTISRSIADTFDKAGAPLTEDQRMLLSGCLAFYVDHIDKCAEWVSCDERLPEEDEFIDIWQSGVMGGRTTDIAYKDGEFIRHGLLDQIVLKNVTHWRRPPQPPQEG